MSDSDERALLLQVSADVSLLEKQMKRALEIVDGSAGAIEKRAAGIGKAMDMAFDKSRDQILDRGAEHMGAFGSVLQSLGPLALVTAGSLAAVGFAVERASNVAEWAEDLERTSKALGISTNALQAFDFAAQAVGLPVERMRETLKGLTEVIGQVQSGVAKKQTARIFDALGISPEQLRNLGDVEHILPVIVEHLSNLPATERAGLAARLKIDPEVLTSLMDAKGGLSGLIGEAQRYGIVVDAELVRKSAEAAERMHVAKTVIDDELRVAFVNLVDPVANATVGLENAARRIGEIITNATDAIGPIQRMIEAMGKIPSPPGGKDYSHMWGIPQGLADIPGEVGAFFHKQFGLVLAPLEGLMATGRGQRLREATASAPPTPKPPPAPKLLSDTPRVHRSPADHTASDTGTVDAALDESAKAYSEAMAALIIEVQAHAVQEHQTVADELRKQNDALNAQAAKVSVDKGLSASKKRQLTEELEAARANDELTAVAKNELIDRKAAEALAKQALDVNIAALTAQSDVLKAQQALAVGSGARRDAALKLLDLDDQIQRAKLDEVIASKTASEAEKKVAQTQLDTLNATTADRRQAVVNANLSPGQAYAKDLRDKNGAGLSDELQKVDIDGIEAFNNGLVNSIVNFKSLGDVAHSVLTTIESDIVRILLNRAEAGILGNLFGLGGGAIGGGGGGGGLLGDIGAGLLIPGFAAGTDSAPGGLSVVGERGPEIVNLPRGAQIIPNSVLAGMGSITPGMGASVTTLAFDLRGAVMTDDLLRQMNDMAANAQHQATANGAALAIQASRQLIPQEAARRASLQLR